MIDRCHHRKRVILANLGIDSFFELKAISWEVGAAKPDPKIFAWALENMNIPADEALHVGDSIQEDVEGAAKAGLVPVLLDRQGVHPGWTSCRLIRTLDELCRIL